MLQAVSRVRAVRGATTVERDEADHVTKRVQELVSECLARNELSNDDLVSILFTATSDISSKFPASAARAAGLDDVPLLGAQELDVEGMVPMCIRLMAHVYTHKTRSELRHVFMHDAQQLRADLAN